jgi:hypothetical protein
VNKGAGDRALPAGDIIAKFLANAALTFGERRAQRALESVMDGSPRTVRSVMRDLRR